MAYLFSAGRPSPADVPAPAGRGHFGCLEGLLGLGSQPPGLPFVGSPPEGAIPFWILEVKFNFPLPILHYLRRVRPSPAVAALAGHLLPEAAIAAESSLFAFQGESAEFARVFSHRSSPFTFYFGGGYNPPLIVLYHVLSRLLTWISVLFGSTRCILLSRLEPAFSTLCSICTSRIYLDPADFWMPRCILAQPCHPLLSLDLPIRGIPDGLCILCILPLLHWRIGTSRCRQATRTLAPHWGQ